ncbi:site-specific integrase [Amycolatopsis sp.]|uniref:site-specific integrase n=1 Tax=Amycolatopsis sp. TaxID=37632 RepID=UPI002E028A5E|nr:tyrosine-type recombinase/integrase [Amycolatopsis sp.]
MGEKWQDNDLVFATRTGTELLAGNVRRAFRLVAKAAGLETGEWTPRELRHSFVSLLSDSGVPIEEISRLCGHKGSAVTEQIYRHQLNLMKSVTRQRIGPWQFHCGQKKSTPDRAGQGYFSWWCAILGLNQ